MSWRNPVELQQPTKREHNAVSSSSCKININYHKLKYANSSEKQGEHPEFFGIHIFSSSWFFFIATTTSCDPIESCHLWISIVVIVHWRDLNMMENLVFSTKTGWLGIFLGGQETGHLRWLLTSKLNQPTPLSLSSRGQPTWKKLSIWYPYNLFVHIWSTKTCKCWLHSETRKSLLIGVMCVCVIYMDVTETQTTLHPPVHQKNPVNRLQKLF